MRKTQPMTKGSKLICPRCKKYSEILSYIPDMIIEEYAHETVPIIKCPLCRWRFALAEGVTNG